MRSNFAEIQRTGVTDEHRASYSMIERTKPIMAKNARNSEKFLTEQQLNQAKEQIDPIFQCLRRQTRPTMEKFCNQAHKAQFKHKRWACLSSSNQRPENRERVHAHIH
jgi:hypothetical protein